MTKYFATLLFATTHFISLNTIAEEKTAKLSPLEGIKLSAHLNDNSYWVQYAHHVTPMM